MSDTNRKEILTLLQAYQPGEIYIIAPRNYVISGFDYYKHGRLDKFKWNKDHSRLTATVIGVRRYSVDFTATGEHLSFRCDCPAWTPSSNCTHVICSIITIKNLLQPEIFRLNKADERHRELLLEALYGETRQTEPFPEKSEKKQKPRGYSIVISKDSGISDIHVRLDGDRIKNYHSRTPQELWQLIYQTSYYPIYGKQHELEDVLNRYGNKYPIILKTSDQEKIVRFNSNKDEYQTLTEMDIQDAYVKVSKVCLYKEKELRDTDIAGNYVFDAEEGTFGLITDKSGWQLWNELGLQLYRRPAYNEVPDTDNTWFSIPHAPFKHTVRIVFSSSEGRLPKRLLLKAGGLEAEASTSQPTYRLTIRPSADKDYLSLQAECLIDGVSASPAFHFFNFLSLTGSGMTTMLRADKRRVVLYQAFFSMLAEKTKTGAETVIKQALSHEVFGRYRVRQDARRLLKEQYAVFLNEERQLLLHDLHWISVSIDKARELSLYKIPFEVFGWEIFREMQAHDLMTVAAEKLYKNLALFQERLQKENVELFFEHKRVMTSKWDFAFEASRPAGIDWFELRPEIRCDGALIDETTWQKIIAGKGTIEQEDCIRIMDADSQNIVSIISDIQKTGTREKQRIKEVVEVPRLQIFDWIMLRKNGVKITLPAEDEDIIIRLSNLDKIAPRPLPSKLKARLRHYQKDGYSWLAFLYENKFGACLADDMGLGKTIQAICLLGGIKDGKVTCIRNDAKNNNLPHLIIMPTSLLFNWDNEIKRFYPDLKVLFYSGKERSTSFEGFDAVLTTYGLIRRDIEKLKDIQFDVIICDEAQAIKNIYADTTGAVRQLKAKFKLALTGTPLENHIGEYYSILDMAIPGLLDGFEEVKPLIKQDVSPALERMLRRTRPFVLRRTKEKILKELPPKIETDIYLDLTEKQKALYKKTVEQIRSAIDTAYSTKTRAQAQIIALTAILKLRQLCVSPQLLSPELREPSPKIDFLIEQLKELLDEKHSALVFSQFTSFLDVLGHDLKKHKIEFLRLDGSTPVKKRKTLVEGFQRAEGPSVFLLSLKAGGQGLNLTRASYVFHLDPWWNPAVENQASDRAHRIGQKSTVTITRILMRHTIEEKMMTLKKRKLELYKAVMEDSSAGKKGLSITKEDFNFLLS